MSNGEMILSIFPNAEVKFYNDQARKPLIFRLGDEWLIHKPT